MLAVPSDRARIRPDCASTAATLVSDERQRTTSARWTAQPVLAVAWRLSPTCSVADGGDTNISLSQKLMSVVVRSPAPQAMQSMTNISEHMSFNDASGVEYGSQAQLRRVSASTMPKGRPPSPTTLCPLEASPAAPAVAGWIQRDGLFNAASHLGVSNPR